VQRNSLNWHFSSVQFSSVLFYRFVRAAEKLQKHHHRLANLEPEREDLKYRLDEEHDRERHVEIGQRVAVQLVLVLTGRVELFHTTPRHVPTSAN